MPLLTIILSWGEESHPVIWDILYYLPPNTYFALILGCLLSWPILPFLQQNHEQLQSRMSESMDTSFSSVLCRSKSNCLIDDRSGFHNEYRQRII